MYFPYRGCVRTLRTLCVYVTVTLCTFPFHSFPFFLVVAYSKNGWTDFHDVYIKRRGFAQGCAF